MLVAQSDAPVGGVYFSAEWWQPALTVTEQRTLDVPYDSTKHLLTIGVYDSLTVDNLPVLDESGQQIGDRWEYQED